MIKFYVGIGKLQIADVVAQQPKKESISKVYTLYRKHRKLTKFVECRVKVQEGYRVRVGPQPNHTR